MQSEAGAKHRAIGIFRVVITFYILTATHGVILLQQ